MQSNNNEQIQDQTQDLHENLNPPPVHTTTYEQQPQQLNNENLQDGQVVRNDINPALLLYLIDQILIPVTPIKDLKYKSAYVQCCYCNMFGYTVTLAEFEWCICFLACVTGLVPWCIYSLIKKGDCSCMNATHICGHCGQILMRKKNCC